jgi:hypothetical protein
MPPVHNQMQILIPLASRWHVLDVPDALLPSEIWPAQRVKSWGWQTVARRMVHNLLRNLLF